MLAVYKREFKSFFDSMLGYVYVAFIILFIGIYFSYYNLKMGYPYFGEVLGNIMFIFLIAIPVLTMKSLAEERKTKTDQILFTSPLSITSVILGKFLAIVTVFAIPIIVSCLCPLIISQFGNAYFLVDYSCVLAFFLMGCAYIAVGIFISSLTESQVLAAVGTFGVLLIMYLMGAITSFIPTSAFGSLIGFYFVAIIVAVLFHIMTKNKIASLLIAIICIVVTTVLFIVKSELFANAIPTLLEKLSLSNYFNNFIYNTFDVTAIVYYLSVGFLFTFLTIQSIQKRRYS